MESKKSGQTFPSPSDYPPFDQRYCSWEGKIVDHKDNMNLIFPKDQDPSKSLTDREKETVERFHKEMERIMFGEKKKD